VRIRFRDVERDAAERAGRQTVARQLRPETLTVDALPQRAAGAAAVEAAAAPAPLITRCINNVGIRRIERDVGEAGVFVDVFDLAPRPPAVGRLVDAAIRTGAEEVTGRGHVDRFGILRVDHDARDRLRLPQADVRERLAAVGRLVDAVAERGRLAIVGFAGPDVHDVGVRWMDRDVADRRGAVGLEHRLEGDAVVLRLENAADGVTNIDNAAIAFRHGDAVDPA